MWDTTSSLRPTGTYSVGFRDYEWLPEENGCCEIEELYLIIMKIYYLSLKQINPIDEDS